LGFQGVNTLAKQLAGADYRQIIDPLARHD
jgi:hypothetical protein